MSRSVNKAVLKSFFQRRQRNALGLTIITAASALITLFCALSNHRHTDVLVLVTIALVALCMVQLVKAKRFFRTVRKDKSYRRKKPAQEN